MDKKIRMFLALLAIPALFGVWGCGESEPPRAEPEGFTFFNVGKNTKLSGSLERELERRLGHGVTERWRTVDLEMNYKGFLRKHFPEIADLREKLKTEVVLKIKENPVKLTYRHTRKKDTPFAFAELVFSNHTKKPLWFRIRPKKASPDIVESMRDKHGEPRITDWDENTAYGRKGRSYHWEDGKDIFMVSVSPDRYGNPEYEIVICYVGNLAQERDIKQRKNKEKKGDALNAF